LYDSITQIVKLILLFTNHCTVEKLMLLRI